VSATSAGAGCGVVLGIVFVLLAQQFSMLSLSALIPSIEYILIGAIIAGLVGAVIGYALGRRYASRHPPPSGGGTTPAASAPSQ
jgi:ABC-type Fe3+-siderophore transport system permease subunit